MKMLMVAAKNTTSNCEFPDIILYTAAIGRSKQRRSMGHKVSIGGGDDQIFIPNKLSKVLYCCCRCVVILPSCLFYAALALPTYGLSFSLS